MANGNPRLEVEIGAITTELKKGLEEARNELRKFSKEASSTDYKSALQAERLEQAKARTEAAQYRAEIAKLALEKRKSQGATQALSGSYREAQQRLTALGRSIREAEGGFESMTPDIQRQIKEYNDLNAKLKAFDAAMGNHQRNVGNYALGFGNVNGVTLEFSRIIQDLPYGMMGIGNNIQQLTSNWQQYAEASRQASAAQGKTVTTGALLGNALSSLLTPTGLLTIGVAALTSGWVLYEKWQQRAKKSTNENTDAKRKMVDALNNESRALYDANANSTVEISKLQTLYKVATDVTVPMNARLKAVKDLKAQYPGYLGDLSNEAILAGNAKKAYNELTSAIIANARARAAESRIAEKTNEQFAIDETNKALQKQINLQKEDLKQKKEINAASLSTTVYSPTNTFADIEVIRSQSKLNSLQKEFTNNLLRRATLQTEINELSEIAVKNQSQITKDTGKQAESTKQLKSYLEQVRDIGQKSQFSLDIASSEGLDKELEKNKQKYKSYLDELDRIEKQNRGKNVENAKQTQIEINNVRKQIIANQALEEQQIRLKYERDTQDLITSILNDAGLSRIKSRQQELDANTKYYDELANKHRENAQVLQAITEARKASENAINEKWDKKAYDDAERLYAKVGKLDDKEFTGKTQEALKKQLDDRLKQIEEFYRNIAKILEALGVDSSGAYAKMLQSFDKVYSQFESASSNIPDSLSKQITKSLSRGIGNALTDLYNNIDDLGSNFYQVFSNVFQRLSGYVGNIMSDVIGRYLGEQLGDKIDAGEFNIGGLSAKMSTAIVAGASLAGKVLGGMISRESVVGQGAAGALSGAASGAAIGAATGLAAGGPIGAAIGGVVGLVSGIFSAKEAKRQRELQEQQLAEQKKQTALMERQAMLAYSASVVGQQVNEGVVTSVERDAYGNLVAKINGKDIELVLERTKSGRG